MVSFEFSTILNHIPLNLYIIIGSLASSVTEI